MNKSTKSLSKSSTSSYHSWTTCSQLPELVLDDPGLISDNLGLVSVNPELVPVNSDSDPNSKELIPNLKCSQSGQPSLAMQRFFQDWTSLSRSSSQTWNQAGEKLRFLNNLT